VRTVGNQEHRGVEVGYVHCVMSVKRKEINSMMTEYIVRYKSAEGYEPDSDACTGHRRMYFTSIEAAFDFIRELVRQGYDKKQLLNSMGVREERQLRVIERALFCLTQ